MKSSPTIPPPHQLTDDLIVQCLVLDAISLDEIAHLVHVAHLKILI